MLVARSIHPTWRSNSWLVAAGLGRSAVVVDAGGPAAPLLEIVERDSLRVELVVLTHHHEDHVAERRAFSPAPCVLHELDRLHVPDVERVACDGDVIDVEDLRLTTLHVPGHTRGQLNVLVETAGETPRLFTGDTLFRGSVGSTVVPGHGTIDELRRSITRLLELPADTIVHPGHGETTTLATERESNPFVRAWRGLDATLDEACTVMGRPAMLLTWTRDHDGGHKAWVRWPDGSEDIVPGSRVRRARPDGGMLRPSPPEGQA